MPDVVRTKKVFLNSRSGLRRWVLRRTEHSDTRDHILLDTFVRALPDEQQRCYVWDKEPDGLEDAVAAALRYEGVHHTEDQVKYQATAHANEQNNNSRKQIRAGTLEVDSLRQEMDKLKERFESTQTTTTRAMTTPLVQPTAAKTLDINELVKTAVENAIKAMTKIKNRAVVNRQNVNPANPALVTCYNC